MSEIGGGDSEVQTTSYKKKISHGDVMQGMGNIVNNTAITVEGDRWYLDLRWGSFHNIQKYQITMKYT